MLFLHNLYRSKSRNPNEMLYFSTTGTLLWTHLLFLILVQLLCSSCFGVLTLVMCSAFRVLGKPGLVQTWSISWQAPFHMDMQRFQRNRWAHVLRSSGPRKWKRSCSFQFILPCPKIDQSLTVVATKAQLVTPFSSEFRTCGHITPLTTLAVHCIPIFLESRWARKVLWHGKESRLVHCFFCW